MGNAPSPMRPREDQQPSSASRIFLFPKMRVAVALALLLGLFSVASAHGIPSKSSFKCVSAASGDWAECNW